MIRASDAHSWVEAYIAGQGWMTFDPTPSVPRSPTSTLLTTVGYYLDAADTFWQDWILNYDLARQFVLGAAIELGLRDMTWLWHPGSAHLPRDRIRILLTTWLPPLSFFVIVAVALLAMFGRSWLDGPAVRLAGSPYPS